ncbi:hypothetical protein ABCR94_06520 [Streptomyces sp. 21So2-11]|uniref:hypothetical protein n=1 Tax=Streptomyces sp. 21So2-11 TaxID=3144408 RepID=UPI00321A10DB
MGTPAAGADRDSGQGSETDTQVKSDGQDLSVATSGKGYKIDAAKNGQGSAVGALKPIGNWTPPPCWYAPKYTPAQLKKEREGIWSAESTGHEWENSERDHYKDFNADKTDKGYWWGSYIDKSRFGDPGILACDKPPFWVDIGDPPPAEVPEVITPKILADLAYAEVRVPDTKVDLAPAANTKVNLPTWAWLDKAEFKPVSVTASVPVLNLQATATAVPDSLQIEPGTKDAVLHPASGECLLNDDGSSIGTPYAKGSAEETPPCGLTYLRASGDGPYKLQATITWKISWTGTGNPEPTNLPDGTFGTTQDITVQEIQAINR